MKKLISTLLGQKGQANLKKTLFLEFSLLKEVPGTPPTHAPKKIQAKGFKDGKERGVRRGRTIDQMKDPTRTWLMQTDAGTKTRSQGKSMKSNPAGSFRDSKMKTEEPHARD